MTRKDYIKIASIIKDNTIIKGKSIKGYNIIECDMHSLVDDFVVMFRKDNNRFDKQRFIDACQ